MSQNAMQTKNVTKCYVMNHDEMCWNMTCDKIQQNGTNSDKLWLR